MPEPGQVEERKKAATRRLPAVGTGDQPYRPSHRPTASGRSPYPMRPADVSYTEQVLLEEEGEVGEVEEEVAVDQRKVVAGRKKMARRSEEVDLASLMKMMIDRDEKWRERDEKRRQDSEDRKREEEAAREKKREEDEAKRQKERDADLRALEERLRREEEIGRNEGMRSMLGVGMKMIEGGEMNFNGEGMRKIGGRLEERRKIRLGRRRNYCRRS